MVRAGSLPVCVTHVTNGIQSGKLSVEVLIFNSFVLAGSLKDASACSSSHCFAWSAVFVCEGWWGGRFGGGGGGGGQLL